MNKNVVMGIVAALALGVALFMMLGNQGAATADDPAEGLDQEQVFVCRACDQDTRMSKSRRIDALRSGTFVCEHCGAAELADAVECPHCHRGVITIGHGRVPSTCPRCNQAIGEWRDVGDQTESLPDTTGTPTTPGR